MQIKGKDAGMDRAWCFGLGVMQYAPNLVEYIDTIVGDRETDNYIGLAMSEEYDEMEETDREHISMDFSDIASAVGFYGTTTVSELTTSKE